MRGQSPGSLFWSGGCHFLNSAGLLIKELTVRGDVNRCLICAPGGLAAQWQDELWFKFQF